MTSPNTAEVSAEHAIWPQDPQFDLALAGGVTTMQILPGSGNLFGGRSVTVKNVPARTADAMKFPGAPYGLKMACGENPKRVYGGTEHRAVDAHGQRRRLPQGLAVGRRVRRAVEEVEGGRRRTPPKRPDRNLQLETLAGVLDGEILIQNHCYRADEMATMIDISKEFGFKIASFHHAVEAYKIRDLLAANDICAQHVGRLVGLQARGLRRHPQNIALVHEAGGCAIVHSDGADGIQRLNQEAAKAMRAGAEAGITISRADAVKWLSINPARALGIDKVTGSLEPGKNADVVDLVGRSVQRLRARRAGLHRRRAGLRSRATRPGCRAATFSSAFCPSRRRAACRAAARLAAHPSAPRPASPLPAAVPVDASGAVAATGSAATSWRSPTRGSCRCRARRSSAAPIVMRGGRIAAVGANVPAPAGARVIDAAGKIVTPGCIDSAIQIGIVEIPLSAEGTADQNDDRHARERGVQRRRRVQRQLGRDSGDARRGDHARADHAGGHRQRVPRPGGGDGFQRRAGAGERRQGAGGDVRAPRRSGRRRRRRLALDRDAAAARDAARRARLRASTSVACNAAQPARLRARPARSRGAAAGAEGAGAARDPGEPRERSARRDAAGGRVQGEARPDRRGGGWMVASELAAREGAGRRQAADRHPDVRFARRDARERRAAVAGRRHRRAGVVRHAELAQPAPGGGQRDRERHGSRRRAAGRHARRRRAYGASPTASARSRSARTPTSSSGPAIRSS